MKYNACLLIIILFLSSSCATLNISEIKNLEKVEFDPVKLRPDQETNNLRIDLIRQTYDGNISDSTVETENVPYHPVGFDLGNGLFFDLAKNLSLRIDYLMDFSPHENFTIIKINRPEKNKGVIIYRFNNDSFTATYPPRKKTHYIYHQAKHVDSTLYLYKNRLKYAISQNDTSTIYFGRRRKWDVIHKLDENQYYLNKRKRKINYQIIGNDLFLMNDYILNLTNNNLSIEIKGRRKMKSRILYTIERSKDKIFIYNEKYSGRKIEFDKNSIAVYSNNTLITKYELIK